VARKVLLADSLDARADDLASSLREAGFRVRLARSAEQVLEQHAADHVDAIVVDLDLPPDGAEPLCGTLRADETLREVSLLVVCRNAEAARTRAEACRANAILTRPLDGRRLLQDLERVFAVPRRRAYHVLVRVAPESGGAAVFCSSDNLSAAGMLVEGELSLPLGARVLCSFFLPGRERVEAVAEVVRLAGRRDGHNRYGVRFLELPPAQRAALSSFSAGRPG
jgi:DNA-binding response OmpR family regulator